MTSTTTHISPRNIERDALRPMPRTHHVRPEITSRRARILAIRKLPRERWPVDLEVTLDEARVLTDVPPRQLAHWLEVGRLAGRQNSIGDWWVLVGALVEVRVERRVRKPRRLKKYGEEKAT